MITMYCVKCRAKREIDNAKAITMKNGKSAMKGKCPTCGTKTFIIVKKRESNNVRGSESIYT